jgi:hypothetical protein
MANKESYDNKFEELIKSNEYLNKYLSKPEVEIENGDFLKYNWGEASFILANSTCFSIELMTALAKKADNELKAGTFFITFTKKLPIMSDKWEIRDGFRRLMSWGIATIYIHRKLI